MNIGGISMITHRRVVVPFHPFSTKPEIMRALAIPLADVLTCPALVRAQTAPDAKWKAVEDAMGRPGEPQAGEVMRFAMPRKDLHVTLGGVAIKPGLALGSWTAFVRTEHGAMVMGDLVLTEDEVGPVKIGRASCRERV